MDGGPDFFDFAGFADEEGTADDAHELTAHELLLLPGAVGCDSFVIGIAQQGKVELVLGLEGRLSFDGIRAHAEDGDLALIKLLFCVTKLGRFDGSTGSVGFRKEEEQDAPALEVFQRDVFAFVGWEPEAGGFVVEFEHEKFLELDSSRVPIGERTPQDLPVLCQSHVGSAIEHLEFVATLKGWNVLSLLRRDRFHACVSQAGSQ